MCKKNDANIFIDASVNDTKFEFSLCFDCASKQITVLPSFGNIREASKRELAVENIICPKCATELKKIIQKGRFGCAKCYELFGDQLLHPKKGDTKTPLSDEKKKTKDKMHSLSSLRDVLKKNLNKAIKQEKYELAAKIRDRLRRLEK